MQVSKALDSVGERCFVDLWVLCADAIADGAVPQGRELEIYDSTPPNILYIIIIINDYNRCFGKSQFFNN